MDVPLGSRGRALAAAALAALTGLAWSPSARADLLVNGMAEGAPAASPPGSPAAVTAYQPAGPAARPTADPAAPNADAESLLALASVLVLPPTMIPFPTTTTTDTTVTVTGTPTGVTTTELAPEPASLITGLLGTGLAGLYGWRRRRMAG
jgi:hypothetical protein